MEIRRVQEIYSKIFKTKIDLPRVVVIGPQSSGKSSVLEQILQFDFLPRGIDMVTRCPIILHLRKSSGNYVVFEGDDVHHTNPKDIHSRIIEKMGTRGISKEPIVLYVHLENTLDITLVDLPGLTKIPVGSQPEDIEERIEEIVLEYASGESTIILAVVSANVDIGTSEALKIAKKVDVDSKRTLGVITKIDLMDKGTDCTRVLRNEYNPLLLGYIGVLNRSFQDVTHSVRFQEVKKREEEFFGREPYAQFKGKIGSEYLLERLHSLFHESIKKKIPTLREEIRGLLIKKREELLTITRENLLVDYYYCLQDIVGYPKRKSRLFQYEEENILFEFKGMYDRFRCDFDFTDLEREIRSSDSLIFHEHILKDLVRKNSRVILKEVLGRTRRFLRILKEAVSSIKSRVLPGIPHLLNSKILSRIQSQEDLLVEDLEKYIRIQSHFINPKHLRLTEVLEKPIFNNLESYLSLKNNLQEEKETIIRLAVKYLEKIKESFTDHSLKSIYFYFIDYLKNEALGDLITLKDMGGVEDTRASLEKEVEDLEESLRVLEKDDV